MMDDFVWLLDFCAEHAFTYFWVKSWSQVATGWVPDKGSWPKLILLDFSNVLARKKDIHVRKVDN